MAVLQVSIDEVDLLILDASIPGTVCRLRTEQAMTASSNLGHQLLTYSVVL